MTRKKNPKHVIQIGRLNIRSFVIGSSLFKKWIKADIWVQQGTILTFISIWNPSDVQQRIEGNSVEKSNTLFSPH